MIESHDGEGKDSWVLFCIFVLSTCAFYISLLVPWRAFFPGKRRHEKGLSKSCWDLEWDHGAKIELAGGLWPRCLCCGRLRGSSVILPWLSPQPHPFPSSPFLSYEICMENRCPCSPTACPPLGPAPTPSSRGGGFQGPSANGCLACLFNIDEEGAFASQWRAGGVCVSSYIYT